MDVPMTEMAHTGRPQALGASSSGAAGRAGRPKARCSVAGQLPSGAMEVTAPMQLLDVRIDERDTWTVVTLTGQLDVATAPGFRQSLQEAQYVGAQRVVVDLAGVEFLDSFGLGVLVGGLRRARLHGGRLVLAAPNDRIRAILEITSLDEAFQLADDVESVVVT